MSNNVLIMERSSSNLQQIEAPSGKTVLEGVFAEFGVENRNGRIYEEKEYLPHLEYLQNDIKSGHLLGELDHPERFEVALGNVSHKISELRYDENSRQIRGKIEILEGTPKGAIAKELLKAGIPLSISSRAAGSVNEDKTVSIQQIYTYDLVAKPGFEKAQLHSVNESAQARISDLISKLNESHNQFETKVSKDLSSTLGIINENISIYDVTDKFPSPKLREEALILKNKNEKKPMNENQNLSEESMQQWTSFVKSEMAKINERLMNIEDSIINGNGAPTKDIKILKGYSNKLRGVNEKHLNWTKEIAEAVNKLGKYTDKLADQSNKHYDKTTKIEEAVDFNAKVLNHTQDWVGENATILNAVCETTDHNAGMVNAINDWTEDIAKGVNELNEWGEEKAQAINGIHEWTSSIAKGLNESSNWSEEMFGRAMSKTDAKKLVNYIELVSEGNKDDKLKGKLDEVLSTNEITGSTVNESIKGIEIIDSVKKTGNVKVDTSSKKATGVNFDGKTITATIKKSKLSKGKKPGDLKTMDADGNPIKVGATASIKGIKVLDNAKNVSVSKDSGGSKVKASNHNLKLNTKAGGKLKEGIFSKSSSVKDRATKLEERLSRIANALEKEKGRLDEARENFSFITLLGEPEQVKFIGLDQSDKEKIAEAVENNPTNDSQTIMYLWENALTNGVVKEPTWLAAAPAKYKKLYEASDEATKQSINAKAEFHLLETAYQIENFWEQSGLTPHKFNTLNESIVPGKVNKEEVMENDYMKSIAEKMKSYNS